MTADSSAESACSACRMCLHLLNSGKSCAFMRTYLWVECQLQQRSVTLAEGHSALCETHDTDVSKAMKPTDSRDVRKAFKRALVGI